MKHVLMLIIVFYCFLGKAQEFSSVDSLKTNYTDANGLKQGHWIYTNAEKHLPGYKDDQLVEEGYFKDNLRVGVWKKYYENGNLEHELTYVNNRPNGYAVFYYRNGIVSEEGVWKNNRWVGEYKYFHENGNLKYEWKYNASGKREGVQKYFHENGQLMIIGNWNEGKETGELKEFFSNGDLRTVKFFNNGDINPDSTKVFPKPEGISEEEKIVWEEGKVVQDGMPEPKKDSLKTNDVAVSTPIDSLQPLTKWEQNGQAIGFFDGNGYYKLTDKNGRITREGDFKKGYLVNGKIYRYDSEGNLEKTIVYKEGKVVEEIDHK